VILVRYLHEWLERGNPFPIFLPFAIKGFFAAIVFSVPWLVWVLLDRRKSSQQHESSSKGATP
jgi:hypothetical protein